MLDVDLDDRYTAASGPALLTGIQALVRLLCEQRRLDSSRGLNTAAYISGYPGSPLGGLDRELASARRHLEPAGVVFEPGVNEELAATAVAGTQLVPELPGHRVDGVTGFWYGKAPGLDRAADAIRHGNVSGTTHLGGAVALIGDDPWCKSSTLPSSCELMAESLVLPLLTPAGVSDIVRLGLHAVAMSRAAGLWTAMKIVSDVADSSAAVRLEDLRSEVPLPPSQSRGPAPTLLGASSVAAEHSLLGRRLEQARDYGREHALNRIVFEPTAARTALLAPGPVFATLRRSLRQLGLDDTALEALGIRLVRIELAWPLHPADIADFAADVTQLVVIEDKRAFVERQVRDALYGHADAPAILGKRDSQGRQLVPLRGAVESDAVIQALGRVLGEDLPAPARQRLEAVRLRARDSVIPLPMARTAFFCSGCPHNLSTRAPASQIVGAGIGCHSLVAVDPAHMRGRLLGAPQMGGEGAQWLGMAPFTAENHYVQNIGDGTFYHSGSLAIRAAVASGANITYRLLYNDAIAMTGGQAPPGRIDIAGLTHWLQHEGVRRVVITSEAPGSFAGQPLAKIAEVRSRDALDAVQTELAAVAGVTVLIHADRCATEERRLRKRGRLPAPAQHAWINERVCEGCGDCGRKSSCLSVVPTQTEFGRKTAIHQASCTQDFSCVQGDCPSFLMITPGRKPPARPSPPPVPFELPEPERRLDAGPGFLLRMPGIGGTGVVTVSQIVQMAALLDGKWASGLDQTGLAQKGGPVVSDVRIAARAANSAANSAANHAAEGAARAGSAEVDVLLGLDLYGVISPDTLKTLDSARTIAVVNVHETATAAAVTDPDTPPLPLEEITRQVWAATRGDLAVWVDAGRMSEQLFGDHLPANVIMLGAAYQHGCLPVSAAAIAKAIELNGASVKDNLLAFDWGRAVVTDRLATQQALASLDLAEPAPSVPVPVRDAVTAQPFADTVAQLVLRRAGDLAGYQNVRYALDYVAAVAEVSLRERERIGPEATSLTAAYARGLYKLMAYKDEYEVARLHLDTLEQAKRDRAFGPGARAEVLLHPPVLRAMGLKRKLRLRRSARPLFAVLRAGRVVRGTPADPFGYTRMRRLERALIGEYRALVTEALRDLRPGTLDTLVAIAALPDVVRGYEQIKLDNIERFRREAGDLLAALS